jgi:hypothetical protein
LNKQVLFIIISTLFVIFISGCNNEKEVAMFKIDAKGVVDSYSAVSNVISNENYKYYEYEDANTKAKSQSTYFQNKYKKKPIENTSSIQLDITAITAISMFLDQLIDANKNNQKWIKYDVNQVELIELSIKSTLPEQSNFTFKNLQRNDQGYYNINEIINLLKPLRKNLIDKCDSEIANLKL